MANVLEQIVATTRRQLDARRHTADAKFLETKALQHRPRGFRKALERGDHSEIKVIAELKKASPSKGLIRCDFRVADLAKELEQAGASALSVLTDEPFFQGSLQNLEIASGVTALPCLRKDFIIDEFQLLEARAYCADAVLLIAAALSPETILQLSRKAEALDLDVLCEVHNREELSRVLDAGITTIGINNRDLQTFTVDLEASLRLVELMPPGAVKVAESGIESSHDVARLQSAGFDAILVGETLMRAQRPGQALQELLTDRALRGSAD